MIDVKYIRSDLYGLIPLNEEKDRLWEKSYNDWLTEFQHIRKKLPKEFNHEFDVRHFHDYILNDIRLERLRRKKKYIYNIALVFQRPERNKSDHYMTLTLHNVSKFNTSLDLNACFIEWLYCEILLLNSKTWSLEIEFSEGGLLCEFEKLEYKEKIGTM